MLPQIGAVTFEEKPEWLKVVLPVRRKSLLFALLSLLMMFWLAALVAMILVMFRERFDFLLNLMLVIWLFFWYLLGRTLWRYWQFYAANREILFINPEQLIVRRPVSILGITDSYDMSHVSPFYLSDKHDCPAFDYAFQHVYFGQGLVEEEMRQLISALNSRYFPDVDND